MKKILAAILLSSFVIPIVYASGKVNFVGRIVEGTCAVNNTGGENFSVNMPNINTSELQQSGQASGRTSFSIHLNKCAKSQISTFFEENVAIGDNSHLINQATESAASHVGIQILNNSTKPILLKSAEINDDKIHLNSNVVNIVDGAGKLDYAVEYYAKDSGATSANTKFLARYTVVYE